MKPARANPWRVGLMPLLPRRFCCFAETDVCPKIDKDEDQVLSVALQAGEGLYPTDRYYSCDDFPLLVFRWRRIAVIAVASHT